MKCIFTLGSPAIGGGTNVIFEHASKMAKEGEDVYIVTDRKIEPEEYAWHTSAHLLKWVTYDDIKDEEFDMAVATSRLFAQGFLTQIRLDSKFFDIFSK